MRKFIEIYKVKYGVAVKAFGMYFYASTRKMKARCIAPHPDKRARIRAGLIETRGCDCEYCGAHVEPGQIQVHHIIPVSERKDLRYDERNLRLVCPECHRRIHSGAFANFERPAELREEVAV